MCCNMVPAIRLTDICVTYRAYKDRPATFKESVLKLFREGFTQTYTEFEALSHVGFEVEKGKVLGIIGSNGAGKSTLLKVLAGVLPPTSGSVEVNGSIDSLISLGAGFDADLNAIENIYLHGALYGRTRNEIKERVDSILEFAELQDFATTPIRYYSSGMFARLGFSVAIDRSPDILIVDEVLAVGDERFTDKCRGVFDSHIKSGRTIVMVSHTLDLLKDVANEIAVMSRGKLVFRGNPSEAIEFYRDPSYQTALTNNVQSA